MSSTAVLSCFGKALVFAFISWYAVVMATLVLFDFHYSVERLSDVMVSPWISVVLVASWFVGLIVIEMD